MKHFIYKNIMDYNKEVNLKTLIEINQQRNYHNIVITDISVGDWITEWAIRKSGGLNGISPSQITYRLKRILKHIGNLPLQDLTTYIIDQCVQELKRENYHASSFARAFGLLSQALEDAVKKKYLAYNPCKSTRIPRYIPPHRIGLSDNECELFLKISKEFSFGLFFCIMIEAALRFGEAQALKWFHVNFKRKTIQIEQQITMRENTEGKIRYTLVPYTKFGKKQIIYPNERIFELLLHEKKQTTMHMHETK